MNKNIETLRKEIDTIDTQLISLLEARFEVTDAVGSLKKETQTQVTDTSREQRIYDKLPNASIKAVYETIITESKRRQRKG